MSKSTSIFQSNTSWSKFFIFYAVFYGVLVDLLIIQVESCHSRVPRKNPVLEFKPQSLDDEGTLIRVRTENNKQLMDSLDNFLMPYKTPSLQPGRGGNIYNCNYYQPAPSGKACDVNMRVFGPCITENNYSFHKSSPCIFLNLNKINGWIPEFYNRSTELPANMPYELKNYIKVSEELQSQTLNTIWVSCEGITPADMEFIGPVDYYPTHGFPGYYFPYENAEGYLSPLVAIHFKRPSRGVLINIECKAWAHNIVHDRNDNLGSVTFELLID